MTPILKYLVCCTQSALIHFRRKPVYPRAENLARCEGLQLMCVITSPAELPKSGIASSFPNQLLGRLAVKNLRLCLFVCVYRKVFLNQVELRWYQGCSKALWMWKIWPQLYHDDTTNRYMYVLVYICVCTTNIYMYVLLIYICTTLCWGNVFIFTSLLTFMQWLVCLQLL